MPYLWGSFLPLSTRSFAGWENCGGYGQVRSPRVPSRFSLLLGPIFIEPLFNEYESVPEGEVKEAVEALAIRGQYSDGSHFYVRRIASVE